MKTILKNCKKCNKRIVIELPDQEYANFIRGNMLIQQALPSVSSDKREMLISGICGECYDAIYENL